MKARVMPFRMHTLLENAAREHGGIGSGSFRDWRDPTNPAPLCAFGLLGVRNVDEEKFGELYDIFTPGMSDSAVTHAKRATGMQTYPAESHIRVPFADWWQSMQTLFGLRLPNQFPVCTSCGKSTRSHKRARYCKACEYSLGTFVGKFGVVTPQAQEG